MVKGIDCSSSGPGFNSQYAHGDSQLSVIPVPESLLASVDTKHAYMHRYRHSQNLYTCVKNKFVLLCKEKVCISIKIMSDYSLDRHIRYIYTYMYTYTSVIVSNRIAVNRHHDHSSSYKDTFNWGWLTILRLSSLLSWLHTGKHVVGEVAKSSTSRWAEKRKTLGLT